MKVKLCDRCGKICGDEKYEVSCTKYIKSKKLIWSGEREKIINDLCDYDLCAKCASEFEKWLECEEDNNA